MKAHLVRKLLAAILVLAAAGPTLAQWEPGTGGGETTFLRSLEGRFSGTGKLTRAGGSSQTLACRLSGDHEGTQVVLSGSCSAFVFSTAVRIDIRYDPNRRSYEGAFRESTGTIADLAGSRQGRTLSFSFTETPESVRPDPPARLTISRQGGNLVLTLRGTRPDQGRNLDLMLRES